MQLMIVCDLFEWKRIDAGVFRLFLYVLPFEIQLSRGEGWDPLGNTEHCINAYYMYKCVGTGVCIMSSHISCKNDYYETHNIE
jgi:hypothetical protein